METVETTAVGKVGKNKQSTENSSGSEILCMML